MCRRQVGLQSSSGLRSFRYGQSTAVPHPCSPSAAFSVGERDVLLQNEETSRLEAPELGGRTSILHDCVFISGGSLCLDVFHGQEFRCGD
jgi:hypothetical protein